jgi:hypothetical protein
MDGKCTTIGENCKHFCTKPDQLNTSFYFMKGTLPKPLLASEISLLGSQNSIFE